jgi:hypothetical protein
MANEQDLTEELNAVSAAHPEVTGEDDVELSEELADRTTIENLFDSFIQEVGEMFHNALDVSIDGNPVRTHLELVNFGQDTIELAYELRRELIARVANRAEQFTEQEVVSPTVANLSVGNQLRKQVLEQEN